VLDEDQVERAAGLGVEDLVAFFESIRTISVDG
jgi:hypothetical protein